VIKPVTWFPYGEPPEAVKYTQNTLGDAKAPHNAEGVLRMLRQPSRFKEAYARFIELLAQEIVQTFQEVELPELNPAPQFNMVPNHFKLKVLNATRDSNLAVTKSKRREGPTFVHFVYVAGSPSEISDLRTVEPYEKNGGGDWKPYLPETMSIGAFAQNNSGIESKELDFFGDSLASRIREIERRDSMVVIFVDSWTLQLTPYKEILEQLNEYNYRNCGIIIPWCEEDQENKDSKQKLQESVNKTFSRYRKYTSLWAKELFQYSINSFPKLAEHLKAVLEELRFDIIQYNFKIDGDFPRSPKSDISKPRI
jgi:FxsC-like protein